MSMGLGIMSLNKIRPYILIQHQIGTFLFLLNLQANYLIFLLKNRLLLTSILNFKCKLTHEVTTVYLLSRQKINTIL